MDGGLYLRFCRPILLRHIGDVALQKLPKLGEGGIVRGVPTCDGAGVRRHQAKACVKLPQIVGQLLQELVTHRGIDAAEERLQLEICRA